MFDTALYSHLDIEVGNLTVSVFYMGATSYALAHNRIPVVPFVLLSNAKSAEEPSAPGELTVRAASNETGLFDSGLIRLPSLSPGKQAVIEPYDETRVPASLTREDSLEGPADLFVTVTTGGETVEKRVDFSVLADNEWFNSPSYYESLAAFVQPNAAAVVPVLSAAADILQQQTGSASLSGYQSGPQRVLEITGAVYQALQAVDVRYINPPASFENTGQRIRSSSDVLESRFGTCIDLSLTFAAVAEQCGLHPVVIMVPGHAMAGVLMTEDPLPSPVLLEPTAINNYIRSGRVLPIDAIFYGDTSFREVVERSRRMLKDSGAHGLIDIAAAHRNGMRPLPYRQVPQKKEDTLPDVSSPATWDLPDTGLLVDGDGAGATAFRDDTDTSPARVQSWKRELLDLSLRNRLLNMKQGPEVLDFLLPDATLADLDDKIHAGEKIAIHPSDDVSDNRRLQGIHRVTQLPTEQLAGDLVDRNRLYADVTGARYNNYFKNLIRLVRTYTEETGSSNLYLTLGALVHTNTTGKAAFSPLFLIPVKIVGGKGRARYQIQVDTTAEASPNYSLVEWLRQVHGITIDALSKPKLDASGLDIDYALSQISEALVKAELPFTVIEKSRLVIAKFSTYGMWKDLRNNWSDFMKSPVFNHLTTKAGTLFDDPAAVGGPDIRDITVDEAELALPIPADGAQLKAITAAAAGYSFVLEGPPGTGKSQTITNLIAHALDKGKKVLFVAEKQAALDVVQERLARVGLAPFTLDLHGVEQKPTAIKKQLKDSIDAEVYYGAHAWDSAVADLRTRLAPLADYPGQIHELNGVDHSLWTATTTLMDSGDGPTAAVPTSFIADPSLSTHELRNISADLRPLAKIMDFGAVDRWRLAGDRIDPSLLKRWEDLEDSRRIIEEFVSLVPYLERDDLDDVLRLLEEAEQIPEARRMSPEQIARASTTPDAVKSLAAEVNNLGQELSQARAVFSPVFIRSGDPTPILDAIEATRKGVFGKKRRLIAYEQSLRIAVPAEVTDLDLEGMHNPDHVEIQLRRLPQVRAAAEQLQMKLERTPGAEPLHGRSVLDPALPAALWQFGEDLLTAIGLSRTHEESLQILEDLSSTGLSEGVSTTLRQIRSAWLNWLEALGATDESVARWINDPDKSWVIKWLESADDWKSDIDGSGAGGPARVTQWSTAVSPLRRAGLDDFVGQIERGDIHPNDIDAALRRGLAVASVSERSTRFRLDDFHPELRDNELHQLTAAIAKVQEESVRALPAKLLRRRPFTPGKLDGRPALLRRQLDAKRNAKSFRNLLQEFGDEILAVAPCFFVSPASLATFVAPGAVEFDIVVFDEASQVTVDQAMGALGRGRSAVIVGDSKQMPPTRIGKAGANTDEDTEPENQDEMADIADLESILSEAVESGLPQVWLSWHYRSKDESLIAFSNEHYYEGNLSSLPSPGFIPDAGVSVTRVDGQFIREKKHPNLRTNPVEAEAIVESVVKRVNDPLTGHESIGVVTFNIQQRNLVLDLLEQSDDPLVQKRLQPGPDSIFVKNLENVQGDERDVILFSTAFSKHEDGRAMPMNFGPLSRTGGERRLNVAVTRARKEVEVFCSFNPNEIDLSRTRSVGMAHLRAYLEAGINGAQKHESLDGSAVGSGLNINPVRDEIAARLQERGWIVEKDFGLSSFTLDLVVRPADDDRWHAAVLTDGEKWASMPTVADRDLTPNLLGTIMEWASTVRVWLPEWIKDPDAVIDRIEASLHDAASRISDLDQQRSDAVAEAEKVLEAERARIEAERREEAAALAQARAELEDDPETDSGEGVDDTEAQDLSEEIRGGTATDETTETPAWTIDGDAWNESGESVRPTGENPFAVSDSGSTPAATVPAPAATPTPSPAPAHSTAPAAVPPKPKPQDPDLFDSSSSPEAAGFRASAGMLNMPLGVGHGAVNDRNGTDDSSSDMPTEVEYVAVYHEVIGEREELEAGFTGERAQQIRDEILLMLEDCAPLKLDVLRSAIAKRFGRQKTSKKINDTVIDPLLPAAHIHDEHGIEFIWPTAGGPSDWSHFRRSEGRNIVDISIHEIANAAKVVLAENPDLRIDAWQDKEDIDRKIMDVFSVSRRTQPVKARIEQALELL